MNGEISNTAIKVDQVSKIYKLYNNPSDRLKEAIHPLGRKYHSDFHAVDDITFSIGRGETVGIVGKNGSGKSTLLKMITGVLTPSSGSIQVNGKISALLELGAGFNPEYTGLENIYLNGTIMGYSKEEMDERVEAILSFADIGEFIYQPVKMYSSGMFVRLAFAVAINVDPDILIVDEALSVGDMRFQQKCFRKIEEFQESKTILFVSHDLSVINKYCQRAIWINEGKLMDDSTPETISKKYQAFMLGSTLKTAETNNVVERSTNTFVQPLSDNLDVLGDNKAKINGISLHDALTGEPTTLIKPNQSVQLRISVQSNELIQSPIIGFSIKDRLGNIVTQSNSYVLEQELQPLLPGKNYIFGFNYIFPALSRGEYMISPAVASGTQEEHTQHSWVHDALVIQILDYRKHQLNGFLILEDAEFYQFE
ncbi:ABC transporter ATP-binding protein [Paenibacillus ehimensis]|uniref:ABC transporter ATP-binding protein n=1 Tax=Paenibacillus ehimensis TaxID=79264 RepID=UPI0004718A14|nr:ABC transporter ATP-binding protein [Paenibacillus ehimensis]